MANVHYQIFRDMTFQMNCECKRKYNEKTKEFPMTGSQLLQCKLYENSYILLLLLMLFVS